MPPSACLEKENDRCKEQGDLQDGDWEAQATR